MSNEPMKQAWNEVAESFSMLGRMMKDRYRSSEAGSDTGSDPGTDPDTDPDTGGDTGTGGVGEAGSETSEAARAAAREAAEAFREAVDRLVIAGRDVGDRVADVAHDDDVKSHAKQTATALDRALVATVDMINEQVNTLFRRTGNEASSETPGSTGSSGTSGSSGEPPAWDPPVDEGDNTAPH